jgi:hypothetical protein
MHELAAMAADAETFGEGQGRGEPLDRLAHVGVVQHRDDGSVRRRAVLLQHGLGDYQGFLGRRAPAHFQPVLAVAPGAGWERGLG